METIDGVGAGYFYISNLDNLKAAAIGHKDGWGV